MNFVGRHVLANIKKNTQVQCAGVRLSPIQCMLSVVYVYVICSACYLSVTIRSVSFPLSQYDLRVKVEGVEP